MTLENITIESQPASKRRYADSCGTALALDLIGERWSLLVVRELLLGPKRFSELRADLPGISANVLTQRLEGLEAHGILRRRRLPPPASARVYELTQWGYEAAPIVQELARWAFRSPEHDPTQWISTVSILLSMRTLMNRDRAREVAGVFGFRFGRESFLGRIENGEFDCRREAFADQDVDVVFAGSQRALANAVYGKVPFADLEAEGTLTVRGDLALARDFTALFALPATFRKPEAEGGGPGPAGE